MCSISRIESVSCYCVRSRYGAPSDRPFVDARTAAPRGFDRLDALCRGRRQPVKGLDRLSGDWRAIKRAPIALDRLPPPARLHPSDQGRFQRRRPGRSDAVGSEGCVERRLQVARQASRNYQNGVESHIAHRIFRMGSEPELSRRDDTALLALADCFGGGIEAFARLDLDKDEHAAPPRYNVDLAQRRAETPRQDAVAFGNQKGRGPALG